MRVIGLVALLLAASAFGADMNTWRCSLDRSTSAAATQNATTTHDYTVEDVDQAGMGDVANNRVNLLRAGKFLVVASIYMEQGYSVYTDLAHYRNGSTVGPYPSYVRSSRDKSNGLLLNFMATIVDSATVNDYVYGAYYFEDGGYAETEMLQATRLMVIYLKAN